MCDPILVPLLKMRPHNSQSSRENATPSSGTSPLASYKEVPPPPPNTHPGRALVNHISPTHFQNFSVFLFTQTVLVKEEPRMNVSVFAK